MTNDGILIFDNLFNRDAAINILKNISLKSNQKKILDVEILDDRKVFYQLNIKSKIKTDEMILFDEKVSNSMILSNVYVKELEHIYRMEMFLSRF